MSPDEVQSWITTCRKDLQTNMGSYLMRTGRDESLLVGDLHIKVQQLTGLTDEAGQYRRVRSGQLPWTPRYGGGTEQQRVRCQKTRLFCMYVLTSRAFHIQRSDYGW